MYDNPNGAHTTRIHTYSEYRLYWEYLRALRSLAVNDEQQYSRPKYYQYCCGGSIRNAEAQNTASIYIYICGISEVQFVAYTPRGSIETWNTWKVPGTGNIHTAVYQCKVVRTEARNTASEYRTYEYRNKSTITASVSGFDTAHTYCYTATTACSSRSIAVCSSRSIAVCMSSIEPWNTGSNRRFISNTYSCAAVVLRVLVCSPCTAAVQQHCSSGAAQY